MYEKGYETCHDNNMLKTYLYCCYRYMPEEGYVKMLSGEPVFLSLNSILKEEMKEADSEINMEMTDELYEEWKKEYRRIDK